MPLGILETGPDLQARALRLGRALDHPICDCPYLALALELDAAFATADARFLRVLRRAGALPADRLLSPPEAAA